MLLKVDRRVDRGRQRQSGRQGPVVVVGGGGGGDVVVVEGVSRGRQRVLKKAERNSGVDRGCQY